MSKVSRSIGVLGRAGEWHWADLTRAATGRCSLVRCQFEDLVAKVDGHGTSVYAGNTCLNELCGIILRAMPRGSLEEIVFRMDAVAALERTGVCIVNSARTCEICIDKFAALVQLQSAGLSVPHTIVCQSKEAALAAFAALSEDVVVKPVFGSEGRGLLRLRSVELAERLFQTLSQQSQTIYLQQYIEHANWDLRLLVIDGDVYAIKRHNELDWRLNATRGANVTAVQANSDECHWARRVAEIVNARFCGVDLIYDRNDQPYILEVNASPGWRYVSQACGVDIAARVLDLILSSR
jgi:ribosomal protein S6--L-glutamate ligase